jgi:hypothetical protein
VKAVAEQGARPQMPKDCPSKLRKVMQACWHQDPAKRPNFGEVAEVRLFHRTVLGTPRVYVCAFVLLSVAPAHAENAQGHHPVRHRGQARS